MATTIRYGKAEGPNSLDNQWTNPSNLRANDNVDATRAQNLVGDIATNRVWNHGLRSAPTGGDSGPLILDPASYPGSTLAFTAPARVVVEAFKSTADGEMSLNIQTFVGGAVVGSETFHSTTTTRTNYTNSTWTPTSYADTALNDTNNSNIVRTQRGLNALLPNYTASADFVRIEMDWQLRIDKAGALSGGRALAGGRATVISKTGTMASSARLSGSKKVQFTKTGQVTLAAVLSGVRKTQIVKTGLLTNPASSLSGVRKTQHTKPGTLTSSAALSGFKKVEFSKNARLTSATVLAGSKKVEFVKTGLASATAFMSGLRKTQITKTGLLLNPDSLLSGLRKTQASKTGELRIDNPFLFATYGVYTFGLSGTTYDRFGGIVGGATVKVFRDADDVKMISTTSHATLGTWAVTLGSDPVTYWVRTYKAGSPNVWASSDHGLAVEETLVQGSG